MNFFGKPFDVEAFRNNQHRPGVPRRAGGGEAEEEEEELTAATILYEMRWPLSTLLVSVVSFVCVHIIQRRRRKNL